ncbi:hypothetical protein EYC98_08120 [Halieaceae bacterium IMCC14734]|uniref:DDE domain-containing protein n=1 Tax=Candidatus Litorirhabdus singularis TaxID=2518993 RepID=A0ABT3TEW4_9GAMM|nr:hypothetical protein [Candidatus Litorirhabdus singularis]
MGYAKVGELSGSREAIRLLRSSGTEPTKIVTDKLRSYPVAHRKVMPDTIHSTQQHENNRVE